MGKTRDKKIFRVIDANANRAREGLRVCEDVCRFVIESKTFTKRFKELRHSLTESLKRISRFDLLDARNIEEDIGRKSIAAELKRQHVADIFVANAQRVKESIRVLEEFAKLINPDLSGEFKTLRYQIYAIEKKVLKKCKVVSHS
ncbi:MAG: thiamine-phosphate pyrophosphorylase [Candidatus Omnitrophica bacterium]|nr:thiamine-phosphate pyrophosphorylase [Candidatus Omnitrophota bacterium]